MSKKLLIFGAGQYGSVVKEIAEDMGCFESIAFLDDLHGEENPDYHEKSIGKFSEAEKFIVDFNYAIPAIGCAEKRLELIRLIEELGYRIPVIVSPTAYISKSAQLQKGVVVEPLAGVHANAVIGYASYISMGAVVNHNAVVLEGCHIDSNAVVKSGALVAAKTTVPPNAVVERAALKVTVSRDGHIVQEQAVGYPQYGKDEEWVRRYIRENGCEPTFF